jgi:hypothetical protein
MFRGSLEIAGRQIDYFYFITVIKEKKGYA